MYRAVVERDDFPFDLRWNAAAIWVSPNCHLVHYRVRNGEQYNVGWRIVWRWIEKEPVCQLH